MNREFKEKFTLLRVPTKLQPMCWRSYGLIWGSGSSSKLIQVVDRINSLQLWDWGPHFLASYSLDTAPSS